MDRMIEVPIEDIEALRKWHEDGGWFAGGGRDRGADAADAYKRIVARLPKQIEVGSRVNYIPAGRQLGTVVAIDGEWAWVRWEPEYGWPSTTRLRNLEAV